MKFFASVIIILIVVLCFSQQSPANRSALLQQYNEANQLYNDAEMAAARGVPEEEEDALNRRALEKFVSITTDRHFNEAGLDSLSFHIHYKIGVLQHFFEERQKALSSYNKAISIFNHFPIPDSFLFYPLLYTGSIYLEENRFDSALHYFRNAEKIVLQYGHDLKESERLYNTLGVVYYEMGNYRNARLYFQKAIDALDPSIAYYNDLIVNYKINQASVLTKLEEFDEAITIYNEILPYKRNTNEILHNIGIINLNLGAIKKSLDYFLQVKYEGKRNIKLYNDIALAYINIREFDNAMRYLDMATHVQHETGNQKNVSYGLTLKHQGDLSAEMSDTTSALNYYQRAIQHFYPSYEGKKITDNPTTYSGVFSYINLFSTLASKGALLSQSNKPENLKLAMDAYTSAYQLADYVERTYESDEARLFLNRFKYTVHHEPIDLGLRLYELTKDQHYLEKAYIFDQGNKASVLTSSINDNIVTTPGMENIRALKASITRLSIKAAQTSDSSLLTEIQSQIRDMEIDLMRLQQKTPSNATRPVPAVKEIQEMLDDETVLFSFHLSENSVIAFFITANEFKYHKSAITQNFYVQTDSFVKDLSRSITHHLEGHAHYLYNTMFSAFEKKLGSFSRMILIPDDELNYVPFEALKNKDGKYLVEKFSITYQGSTRLLRNDKKKKNQAILSFAPFTKTAFKGKDETAFSKLEHSRQEIEELDGSKLFDEQASKLAFLKEADESEVLHLATHAVVSPDPQQSYIAFYPASSNDSSYRLYASEVSTMQLPKTNLVVLSACETGTGQLVKGEGLMSLSRAFAYAGCPNIITTLWKAEDATTAFITRQLHRYLKKGVPKDIALQKAKLDLLASGEIQPSFKTPAHWAHIVFIGNYQPKNERTWLWLAAVASIILIFTYFSYRLFTKKSRRY